MFKVSWTPAAARRRIRARRAAARRAARWASARRAWAPLSPVLSELWLGEDW